MKMARGTNTITARVALDGGKEFREELKGLGEEGEKALGAIGAAAKNLKLGDELKKSLAGLKTEFAGLRTAALKVRDDFRRLGDAGRDLGRSLLVVGRNMAIVAGAAVAAGAAIFKLAKSGADAADAAAKQAAAVGMSIDSYGALQFAFEQSGLTAEEFGSAMSRLNQTIGNAAGGNAAAAAKFTDLGISIRDANGNLKTNEQILKELANVIARMPDGLEKSALSMEFFGRSGAKLVPLLNEAGVGIERLMDRARALGITFTEEQGRIATAMNDALNELTRARQGISAQLGLIFAPAITKAAEGFTEAIVRNRQALLDWADNTVGRAVRVMGELVEVFILGGAEINKLDPATVDWAVTIIEWRDAIKAFGADVRAVVEAVVIPAFNALMAVFDLVAAGINGIFGTDFTGRQVAITAAIAKLIGIFGVLGASLGVVKAAIPLIISLFGLIVPSVATVTAAFGVFVAGLKVAGAGLLAIAGWPVVIAAALGALAVTVYMFWDDIVDYGAKAWDAIKDGAANLASTIGEFFSAIGGELWEDVKSSASAAWDAIASGASAAGRAIGDAFSTVKEFGFDGVAQVANQAWDGIKNGASSAWDLVASGADLLVIGLQRTFEGLGIVLDIVWQGISAGAALVWSGIETAAVAAWDIVGNAARGALDNIAAGWDLISDGAAAAWDVVSAGAQGLWDQIASTFEQNQAALLASFERLFGGLSDTWQNLVDEAQAVRDQLIAPFEQAGNRIKSVWDDTGRALARALGPLPDIARRVAEEVAGAFDGIAQRIEGAFANAATSVGSAVNTMAGNVAAAIARVQQALAALERQIRAVMAAAAAARAAASSSSSSSSSAGSFAAGGMIHGPGTGTSDSIPAWVSAGEFINTARSVRHYGAEVFALLNNMRIPKRAIMEMLASLRMGGKRFASGGMVQTKMGLPAFSMGGLAEAMNQRFSVMPQPLAIPNMGGAGASDRFRNMQPVTIDMGGGRQIAGLYAGPDVIDELMRASSEQQMLAIGPAPSWSGRR
jgi:hypothetical protein